MKPKHYLSFLFFVASAVYSPLLPAQVITTFAGNGFGASTGSGGYSGDNGLAINAELNNCTAVAVDGAGNVYIADMANNVVRKVNTSGVITTFAGDDTVGYAGNGGQATKARLNSPFSVATDVAGNVYISDMGNNVVRVVSTTGIINTYAGNDTAGYRGDGFLASHASLRRPAGIAFDASGNLYIADQGNNVIRKVSTGGIINTIAGTGTAGSIGDGGAAVAAELNAPSGVAVDVSGNVYIADAVNNVVREVLDSNGNIITFAGNYVPGNGGDGGAATAAQLSFPSGISLDEAGSVYIADEGNNTIRRVDSLGNISIFAGKYTNGYTGDNGLAINAELGSPKGVYADGWGRIYIADYNNNVVRVVLQGVAGVTVNAGETGLKIYPNPSNGTFVLELPGNAANAYITVTDVLGNVVATNTAAIAHTPQTILSLGNVPAGNYFVRVVTADKTYVEKIEVVK